MQTDIQKIYTNAIRPLTSNEKLRLARLILEEVTDQAPVNGEAHSSQYKGDITRFFGSWKGRPEKVSASETIDAD
jgi:hypothetical protein